MNFYCCRVYVLGVFDNLGFMYIVYFIYRVFYFEQFRFEDIFCSVLFSVLKIFQVIVVFIMLFMLVRQLVGGQVLSGVMNGIVFFGYVIFMFFEF